MFWLSLKQSLKSKCVSIKNWVTLFRCCLEAIFFSKHQTVRFMCSQFSEPLIFYQLFCHRSMSLFQIPPSLDDGKRGPQLPCKTWSTHNDKSISWTFGSLHSIPASDSDSTNPKRGPALRMWSFFRIWLVSQPCLVPFKSFSNFQPWSLLMPDEESKHSKFA